jgi:hypothetical protein
MKDSGFPEGVAVHNFRMVQYALKSVHDRYLMNKAVIRLDYGFVAFYRGRGC